MSNNLLVQETQDPGVNKLTQAITSNQIEGTLASTRVEQEPETLVPYNDVAKKLLDRDLNVVGVIRNNTVHVRFQGLNLTKNDRLVYISTERHDWDTIQSYLA